MTLCFSQEQAAAVYAATKGSKPPVYLSPVICRLDDIGQNGVDLLKNIGKMYAAGDSHVLLLAASIRNLQHLLYSFHLDCCAAGLLPSKVAAKVCADVKRAIMLADASNNHLQLTSHLTGKLSRKESHVIDS